MFLSKSFVKTVLIYIFVAFFQILTYLFFNDWYIFGPQLTARTKKTEKIFPFPLIFPFQVHFFYPWGTKMWFSCNLSVWKSLTILILPLNLWPAALYPFLITFPSSRFVVVFREFKIRRLRTTTTVKHATAHNQNHVTVHFSRVVLQLRWVVELFRVVGTTENILLVFCRLGNSRISSFRKKVFNSPALSEREAKYVSCV